MLVQNFCDSIFIIVDQYLSVLTTVLRIFGVTLPFEQLCAAIPL